VLAVKSAVTVGVIRRLSLGYCRLRATLPERAMARMSETTATAWDDRGAVASKDGFAAVGSVARPGFGCLRRVPAATRVRQRRADGANNTPSCDSVLSLSELCPRNLANGAAELLANAKSTTSMVRSSAP